MSGSNGEGFMQRLVSGLSVLTEQLAVSGLWLLGCLPVVTIGASTAAAYYTVVKAIRRRRDGIWRAYRAAFLENLRQGLVCSLVLVAVAALLVFYWLARGSFSGGLYSVFFGLVVALALLFSAILAWFFPVLSRFRQGLGQSLPMALAMALGHPFRTLALVAQLALCGLLCLLSPPLLLLLPGVYNWAASFLLEPVLRAATDARHTPGDDTWYLE